jgi:hypothetical protein
MHLLLFTVLYNILFYLWKEKQIFALHMFYFAIVNCFHSFMKCIVQWKIKYSKWNGSAVKRRFYIPKFGFSAVLCIFLYSPIPMPLRTIFPRFYTSLDNAVEGVGGRSLYKLLGPACFLYVFVFLSSITICWLYRSTLLYQV